MVAFVFLFEAFTFFELLDDIARHHVAFLTVVDYFGNLTPYLLYQLAPLGALVATLVTIGVMSKNNEIVACKASGISLYRLAGAAAACRRCAGLDDDHAGRHLPALREPAPGRAAQPDQGASTADLHAAASAGSSAKTRRSITTICSIPTRTCSEALALWRSIRRRFRYDGACLRRGRSGRRRRTFGYWNRDGCGIFRTA